MAFVFYSRVEHIVVLLFMRFVYFFISKLLYFISFTFLRPLFLYIIFMFSVSSRALTPQHSVFTLKVLNFLFFYYAFTILSFIFYASLSILLYLKSWLKIGCGRSLALLIIPHLWMDVDAYLAEYPAHSLVSLESLYLF